jgi:hypothetical protein
MGGTGLEPVTPSLSRWGRRSRQFASVRSDGIVEPNLEFERTPGRTRANADPCHSCHAARCIPPHPSRPVTTDIPSVVSAERAARLRLEPRLDEAKLALVDRRSRGPRCERSIAPITAAKTRLPEKQSAGQMRETSLFEIPQPERLDQLIDLAGGDADDVGLLHDRDQRLLAALARLQERGK